MARLPRFSSLGSRVRGLSRGIEGMLLARPLITALVIGLGTMLLVASLAAVSLWHERDVELERSTKLHERIARTGSVMLQHPVEAAERILRQVAERHRGGADPFAEMGDAAFGEPGMYGVGIADGQGRIVAGRTRSGALGPLSIDPADNELRTSGAHAGIGRPLPNGAGPWLLPLVLPLVPDAGGVEGWAVVFLDLDTVSRFFADVRSDGPGVVALLRRDRVLLMRSPMVRERIGTSVDRPGFRQRIQDATGGSFIDHTPADDRLRLISWSQVAGTDMLVTATTPVDEVLAYWRQHVMAVIGVLCGVGALLVGAMLLVARVLRQQMLASEALRHEQIRFRDFVEAGSDGYFELNPAGGLSYASPSFQQRTRVSPEDYVNIRNYGATPSEVMVAFRARWAQRMPYRDVVFSFQLPGGPLLRLRASGLPVYDDDGTFIGYRGTASNVTELERARTAEFQASKLVSLGQLAGGVAHDFNNILGAILGYASFLEEDLPANAPEHAYAAKIRVAAQRAEELVQQILAFAGSTPTERRLLPLQDAVSETIGLLRAALPTSSRLDVQLSLGDALVLANPTQLTQLLLNLGKNAHDALSGMGGTVVIQAAVADQDDPDLCWAADPAKHLDIVEDPDGTLHMCAGVLDPAGRYARLTVIDDGVGFGPEIMRRLFEPFFSTKRQDKGTGLGLAVVHGIVTSLSGVIVVASKPGAGSRFTILLPLAKHFEEEDDVHPGEAVRDGAGRVLVVDDDEAFGGMLVTALRRRGYDPVLCMDGEEGVARFRANPDMFALVLTDQTMPGLDGVGVIRAVKSLRPRLPCVLCTGYSEALTESGARAAGADRFLTKPVAPDLLAQTMRELLDA